MEMEGHKKRRQFFQLKKMTSKIIAYRGNRHKFPIRGLLSEAEIKFEAKLVEKPQRWMPALAANPPPVTAASRCNRNTIHKTLDKKDTLLKFRQIFGEHHNSIFFKYLKEHFPKQTHKLSQLNSLSSCPEVFDPLIYRQPRKKNRPVHCLREITKPSSIHYPEDYTRDKFFADHPYERLRPTTLKDDAKKLSNQQLNQEMDEMQWKDGHVNLKNVNDVIRYQSYLIKEKGIDSHSAYHIACKIFYKYRANREMSGLHSKEETQYYGNAKLAMDPLVP